MVFVKGGEYEMGDTFRDGYKAELPVHQVKVDDFYIGKYLVTFKKYDAYCEETGIKKPDDEGWGRDKRPVINVNWEDAVRYCEWLSEKTGKEYRLLTEAEWEYAARSGGKKEKYAGTSGTPDAYAWHENNSGGKTHPVGKKKPNGLGLYDMSGNLWEWVSDWYNAAYYKASPRDNPQGPSNGKYRVLRGGSWYHYPRSVRASSRYRYVPSWRDLSFGFRCASTP
jgi:formylglycine-generating enzyme required for sulfatase activity